MRAFHRQKTVEPYATSSELHSTDTAATPKSDGGAALARGVKVTGATVHFVNEIPDGGEIILQKAVEIEEGDTPETLQRRVMEQAEWKLLPRATELVCRAITEEEN